MRRLRWIVLIPLVLTGASAAVEAQAFYVQKARNLVFADLSLGTPQQYEELVGRVRADEYTQAALLLEDILDAAHIVPQRGRIALGYLWAAAGDYQLALDLFEEVGEAPHHFQVTLARALCLHDLGRLAESAALFGEVGRTSVDPGERRIAAWNCLVDYREAAAGYIFTDDEAGVPQLIYDYLSAYEELGPLFEYGAPELPRERLLADLADTLARFGLNGAAGKLWRAALEAPLPDDAPSEEISRAYAAVKLADLARADAAYTAATAWLERALELAEPGGELHRYAANQLETLRTASQGRIAEALISGTEPDPATIDVVEKQIDGLFAGDNPAPNLAAAELVLGELGDVERGRDYLEDALEKGESAERVAGLAGEAAYALAKLEHHQTADELYELALRADPDNAPLIHAHRLNSVRLILAEGDDEEAAQRLSELIEDADPGASLEAALLLLELGRRHENAEWIWRAVEVGGELGDPARLPLLLAASEAFLLDTSSPSFTTEDLRERRNQAIVNLAEAIQNAPEHQRVEIRIRTGLVFRAFAEALAAENPQAAADERDKARQAWERAREAAQAAGDDTTVNEIQNLLDSLLSAPVENAIPETP